MKPPVAYDTLAAEWSKDAPWDQLNPDMAMAQIPNLHAKYVHVLTYHNLLLKKNKLDYAQKKKFKTEYFSGELNNPEDLAKYKLEPFLTKVGDKTNKMDMWLAADEDLAKLQMKQAVNEEIVSFCTLVIKELNARTYQINGLIKYRVYMKGNDS